MPPVLDAIKALQKFKNLRKIQKGTLDGNPIEIVEHDIDVHGDRLELTCKYKEGGTEHRIEAKHFFNDSNEIKIDGADVDHDDVDLDLDSHLLRLDLEYRLEYTQSATPHVMVLTATAKLI